MFLVQTCFFFLATLGSVLPLFQHLHPTLFDSLAKALDAKQPGISHSFGLNQTIQNLVPASYFAPNLCGVLNSRLYC